MPRSVKPRPKPAPPKRSPGAGHIPRERLVELFVAFFLAVATILVYCPAFDHPFIYFDDEPYVTRNEHVQAGLTAAGVRWAFSTFEAGNWHPLTWLSLELDSTLYGGLNAGGFHLTNILLHTASTILLFLVLARMTGRVGPSAFVAALFALNPLNVEPVAWVAERKGVLSALFWMLTLAAYLYYVRRPSVLRYLLVVLSLVFGLMAKPTAMTLPAALLLLDYWPLARWHATGTRRLLLEKVPLFAIVICWVIVAYLAQSGASALPSSEIYPFHERIWNALLSYVAYLGKAIWPVHLAAYYPHPGASVSVAGAVAAGLLLAIITVLFAASPLGGTRLKTALRTPYLLVGWLWYLGTLVPMIGLVQIGDHGMADRYTYIPMIGIFLALTWAAADLAKAWNLPRLCLPAAAAVLLLVCINLTWTQLAYWRSDFDLWVHALTVTKNNAMAHNNLGMAFYRRAVVKGAQNDLVTAQKEFETAVAIDPGIVLFHHNLATALRDLGRADQALREFRKVVAMTPREPAAYFNLANLLRDMGRAGSALEAYHEAINLDPGHPVVHNNLAGLYRDLGWTEEAFGEYDIAIELDPTYASAHAGRGNVFHDIGSPSTAIDEYRKAIDLDPDNGLYHNNLALALQADGRLEDALAEFRKAQDLGYPQAAARLHTCGQLRQLHPRLPDLIAGKDRPKDNAERVAVAGLCAQPFVGRYALAARLYADAFSADSALAEDPRTSNRFDAAVAAARAGCDRGNDAAELTEEAKAKLRTQALVWLQAELTRWNQLAAGDRPDARVAVQQTLLSWQRNNGFDGVRDPTELAQLPEADRQAWQKFWEEVDVTLEKAGATPVKKRTQPPLSMEPRQ